jgi:membrane dipeptidase
MSIDVSPEALALHRRIMVVDGLVTGPSSERMLDNLEAGGVHAGNWTVSGHEDHHMTALMKMEERRWLLERVPHRAVLAQSVADIERAHREGKFACVLGFQGGASLEDEFHLLAVFWRLGLRVLQLTYNEQNHLGYGCLEPDDRGLTHFGIQVVRDCNRLGLLVDLSHAGARTALDAVEVSRDPVTVSHAGAYTLRPNPRNLRDEVMKAIVAKGGVVGAAAFSDFVGDTTAGKWPTIEDYLNHIDYMVGTVGPDNVAIGSDMLESSAGPRWDNNTLRKYPEICGGMTIERHQIEGFPNHSAFPKITEGLLRRGYTEADIEKIMGQNLLRLYRRVWRC